MTSSKIGAIGKLLYVLRGNKAQLMGMGVLFLGTSILDLIGIGLIGPFIGAVVDPTALTRYAYLREMATFFGSSDTSYFLIGFGVALMAFYMIKGVVAYLVQRRILSFAFSFRAQLVRRLMEAYLSMPYRFYLDRNSSAVIRSITHDTKVMVDDLLLPALRFASDATVIVFALAFLAWVSWPAVLFTVLILGGAFAGYALFVRPRVRIAGKEVAIAHGDLINGVQQAIAGIKEVRALGVEAAFFGAVSMAADRNSHSQTSFNVMLAMPRYLMETVITLVIVILAIFVLLQGEGQENLVPLLAMFAAAGLRILPAAVQTSAALASMNYSVFALNAVYEDVVFFEKAGTKPLSRAATTTAPKRFERLGLEKVHFRHEGAPSDAIASLDLTIKRGETIGLIGPSGAGKTTLVDILLGFHTVTAGKLSVDGVNINDYGWDAWRRHIAYIPQNPVLLDDTIEANIAFGTDITDANRGRLQDAIRDAQLSAFIARSPDGARTVIGERGIRLSGGERQRIALARGLFFDRDVFILDEATSALDNETERQVIEVLEKLRGGKTLIVIAHRLTTVRNCDIIYRLENGRIVKFGSYEQVIDGVPAA